MQTIEYETEITLDGRLDLPADLLRALSGRARTPVRVVISFESEKARRRIPHLAGRWQDARSSEEIVAAIRSDRADNRRSEQMVW